MLGRDLRGIEETNAEHIVKEDSEDENDEEEEEEIDDISSENSEFTRRQKI